MEIKKQAKKMRDALQQLIYKNYQSVDTRNDKSRHYT